MNTVTTRPTWLYVRQVNCKKIEITLYAASNAIANPKTVWDNLTFWHIPWSKATSKTIRAVVTDPDDIRLPNNSLEIEFRARWKRGMLMLISRLGEKEEGERQGMGEG